MGRLASHHFSISTPSHSSFYIAALLLTCAIRTTLGAYRQVSPGSAWTRLRSHGRVGGALHRKQAQRRSCRRQHSAEEYGPDGGSVRGGTSMSPTQRRFTGNETQLTCRSSTRRSFRVRQGHRFRSSTRRSFRGYDKESRHGGGQYTTTRPHRHQSCTEVI